jgi:hypothetical protein
MSLANAWASCGVLALRHFVEDELTETVDCSGELTTVTALELDSFCANGFVGTATTLEFDSFGGVIKLWEPPVSTSFSLWWVVHFLASDKQDENKGDAFKFEANKLSVSNTIIVLRCID